MGEKHEKRNEYPKTRRSIRDTRLLVIDGITTFACFVGDRTGLDITYIN
jgi:hypothetical protein